MMKILTMLVEDSEVTATVKSLHITEREGVTWLWVNGTSMGRIGKATRDNVVKAMQDE